MKNLHENTIDGAAPNIATTDQILDFNFFADVKAYSLAAELFPSLRLDGATGALINATREIDTNGDWKVVAKRKEVQCYDSKPEKTGITQEALEDLVSMYGDAQAQKIFKNLIEGIANDDRNAKVIEFLDVKSAPLTALEIREEATKNAKLLTFLFIQKVNEIIHNANKGTQKTYGAYCLLPARFSAAFDILRIEGRREELANNGNIVCDTGSIVFVRNPLTQEFVDALGLSVDVENDVFVGLRDMNDPTRSCAVYSPYKTIVVPTTNPENGDIVYHLFDRYAITDSPLHDISTNPLMWKFTVQEV